MTEAQKIIKYLAIAFAIFLVFSIVSSIMLGISIIGNIFNDNDNITSELTTLYAKKDSKILDIDITSANLTIKKGEQLKIETDNKNIKYTQDDNIIKIKEKKSNWFRINNNSSLIIYIPENYVFDGVSIDNGAGKVTINEINTDYFSLNLGAGKVEIDKLNVTSESIIDGGAGEVTVLNGDIKNLDLDMGVGKITLNTKMRGNNKIDGGVGEIVLNLFGTENDYQIEVDKGIGTFKIDGNSVKDNNVYGNGLNKIDIDGGIGNIDIKFSN